MKTLFLTSSPCPVGEGRLNEANGFAERLISALPLPCRALFLCSNPADPEGTDGFAGEMREVFERSGVEFASYEVLDGRNEELAGVLVDRAELLILAGGHVPTQNRFFHRIRLRELLRDYEGVIVGISAGTMNCAETVYVQPEEPGESDPAFPRFLPGLGLTKKQILPHYQQVRDDILDGKRLFEEITYPDSLGHRFYVFPDGTWLYGREGLEQLRGESWLLQNGELKKLSEEGDVLLV